MNVKNYKLTELIVLQKNTETLPESIKNCNNYMYVVPLK